MERVHYNFKTKHMMENLKMTYTMVMANLLPMTKQKNIVVSLSMVKNMDMVLKK